MAFGAAVFDMDGLLIDSERVIMQAWMEAARDLGLALAAPDYLRVVGRATPESNRILASLLGGEDAFRATRSRAEERLAHETAERAFPLKPGAAELLAAVRALGVRCAVASSSAVGEIEHRLGRAGVRHHFAAVSGGDEVPRGKPDPALYRLAAARLDIDAGRCIAFEDSDHGATAALAAGLQVVVVPDLKAPSAELARRCLLVLPSLEQALDHLPGWFAGA